jgi:exonuclease SbcC
MIKLLQLKFCNIGRFIEEQTINFDDLGILSQIDGNNKNTDGSSGSGKSTVFKALEYLLGLNDIPNTILQSRLTKETISVSGNFLWNDKNLTIKRSKAKGLEIELNGELFAGSSKIMEEKLDQILVIPRHLLRPMIHKRQNEGGFFLDFTPSQIHKFLTDCLNLTEFTQKTESIQIHISELEKELASSSSQLLAAQASLGATQKAIDSLGEMPKPELTQLTIDNLKLKFHSSEAALQNEISACSQEMQSLELLRPVLQDIPWDTATIQNLENQLGHVKLKLNKLLEEDRQNKLLIAKKIEQLQIEEKDRQAKIRNEMHRLSLVEKDRQSSISAKLNLVTVERMQLNLNINEGISSKEEALRIAEQIKKIRENICPTCERDGWINESVKTQEERLLNKLKILKENIIRGNQAQERLVEIADKLKVLEGESVPREIPNLVHLQEQLKPQVSQELLCLQNQLNSNDLPEVITLRQQELSLNEQIKDERKKEKDYRDQLTQAQRSELLKFEERRSTIVNTHTTRIETARGQRDLDRRVYESACQQILSYSKTKDNYEKTLSSLKEQLLSANQTVQYLSDKIKNINLSIGIATESKRAIHSFISCLFDDVLENIGESATQIVRAIPNMATATIQLDGTRETKDGKIKEEVNATISVDGEIEVPIKSLSGGERAAVDLAIDLAVISFIEDRSGLGIDIFALDEPFGGLDTISIEMILDMLKNINLNKKLILIDHNPIIKEMVHDRIVVVREGQISNIKHLEDN